METVKFATGTSVSEITIAASLSVLNHGMYVARMAVSYILNDKPYRQEAEIAPLASHSIQLPAGATNIKLEVFAVAVVTRPIFQKSYDKPATECFKVWGTIFDPQWAKETC